MQVKKLGGGGGGLKLPCSGGYALQKVYGEF